MQALFAKRHERGRIGHSGRFGGLRPSRHGAGSGSDEIELSWQITYEGPLESEMMLIRLAVTESGEDPTTFVASEAMNAGNSQVSIRFEVGPACIGRQLDGVPELGERLFV